MKKPLKITLIAVGTLAVLVLAAAIAAGPVAKRYIEKHDRELLGRSIRMERLRMNIFTGRLRVEGLRIGGAEDSTTFFSLDSFDMRLRLLPLLANRVHVRHIHLAGPDVKVYQQGNRFSFDDILHRFATDTTAQETPAEPSRPWEIGIYDIAIRQGHLFYKDLALGATWGLNDINLRIPGVYFSGAKTDVGAVLNFAEGGSLATQVAYDIATSEFDIGLKLQGLTLAGMLPYFRQSLDVGGVDGRLSADIRLRGDTEHLLSMRAEGEASLAGFSLRDTRQQIVAGVDTLGVRLAEGDLGKRRLLFDRIHVGGFSLLAELTPEGNNLSALMKSGAAETAAAAPGAGEEGPKSAANGSGTGAPATPAHGSGTGAATADGQGARAGTMPATGERAATPPAAAVPSAPAPTLRIADLEIVGGRITLRDRTLRTPFEYTLSDIRMRSRDFDPSTRNRLQIDARMQRTGEAKLRWEGTLDDLNNQNITLWLTNLDLRDFSPYCEHYTAYPLTKGNLSFRSQNVIRNRYLDGTNHLDVFEPGVDRKRRDIEPELHVPLKLGLFVLKDKKGHVKMDLPVGGNLDSPEFSYRKIVLKAIGNVLLKVVTAPFSFLSGGGRDDLRYIALDPAQYAFTSEQYAAFDRIAEMLRDKPGMQVALTQRINLHRALPAQAVRALQLEYRNHLAASDSTGQRPRLSMLEYEKLQQTDIRTPEIAAFADSLLAARGLPSQGLSPEGKALALFGERARGQLLRMMAARDESLRKYMLSTHGVQAPAFALEGADSTALDAYRGRDRYTIALGVEGETQQLEPEETEETETSGTESNAPDAPNASDAVGSAATAADASESVSSTAATASAADASRTGD